MDETGPDPEVGSVSGSVARFIVVSPHELRLREKVKAAGRRWHPEEIAWSLPYDRIVALGLTRRIISEHSA